MIVLVPLSRFRITYEVAAGRPFSQFERLILRAIKEGASELSELRDEFQVHPRLLIEGLVTLTHAGWLAIGGPGHEGFLLTSGGREAATSDQPPSTTEVASRQASIVMERLSGALISNREVRFASRKELGDVWDRAVRLTPDVTVNQLDEGQVQHLLPRKQGEWLRWIGPIDMLTKGANWLPISVDIRTENVAGLPDPWIPRLQATILTRARRAAELGPVDEIVRSLDLPPFAQKPARVVTEEKDAGRLENPRLVRPSVVSEEDFFFTSAQHEDLMVAGLNEASSSVFVASPCPSLERLEPLRDRIEAALSRGVNVDLLFGNMAGGDQNFQAVSDWSSKIAYEATRADSGRLRFSRQPASFGGNLLLWDGRGEWSACVGSYNWLAMSERREESGFPRDITVRISEPGVVAALARCAIGVWSGVETEVLSSTADRWRSIAAELDMIASRGAANEANANLCLVLDGEHETLIDDWNSRSESGIFVASHELGSLSKFLGADPNLESVESSSIDIVYGRTDKDQAWLSNVASVVGSRRGSLRQVENFHGEVLIADGSACVTSYRILAATSGVGSNGGREIGVAIEGRLLVDWLRKQLNSESI